MKRELMMGTDSRTAHPIIYSHLIPRIGSCIWFLPSTWSGDKIKMVVEVRRKKDQNLAEEEETSSRQQPGVTMIHILHRINIYIYIYICLHASFFMENLAGNGNLLWVILFQVRWWRIPIVSVDTNFHFAPYLDGDVTWIWWVRNLPFADTTCLFA